MNVMLNAPDATRPLALVRAIKHAIPGIQHEAAADAESFPADGLATLRTTGALAAPLPGALGGLGLGTEPTGAADCAALLAAVGEANLSLGRVFEAHLNAIRLLVRYGNNDDHQRLRARVQSGALFALWVTDGHPASALRAERVDQAWRLSGRKGFCSAVGHATEAVVTACTDDPAPRLFWVTLNQGERHEASAIGLTGMRASATGAVDFSGITVPPHAAFGVPGDYLREPDFSTGAWRGSAVAWGGLRALTEAVRRQLTDRGRHQDPHQQARFGRLLIAVETARHFVLAAAQRGEAAGDNPSDEVAYVNLSRIAVERACLDGIELVQRALGLQAFVNANPVAHICADLAVYLRQPAPDEVLTSAATYGFAHGQFP